MALTLLPRTLMYCITTAMAAPVLIDDMGVDNVAFLIENLGADASELQYL